MDLCVDFDWRSSKSDDAQMRLSAAKHLREMGFHGVAWNTNISDSDKDIQSKISFNSFNPSKFSVEYRSLLSQKQYAHLSLSMFRYEPYLFEETNFLQLSRTTIVYSNTANISTLNAFARNGTVDIVVVKPTDEKSFLSAVSSAEVDAIQLDFSRGRSPYPLKRTSLNNAVNRGVMFEIVIGKSWTDPVCRRNLFSSIHVISRFVPLSNIIICSGITPSTMSRLDPKSLIDFCIFLQIAKDENEALSILSDNPMELLHRSAARRSQCGNVTLELTK